MPYHYGIEADALDELDRLQCIAAFIADAISCIADSVEDQGELTKKSWQGLYYLSEDIADRMAAISKGCGAITK